jgi:hypothetical protein
MKADDIKHGSEGKRFLIVGFVWNGDIPESVTNISLLNS